MEGNPPLDLFSPFGPLIGRTKVPGFLIDHLNEHADGVLAGRTGGAEFLLSPDVTDSGGDDSLGNFLAQEIARYVGSVDERAVESVSFESFWCVSQPENTASPMHFHSSAVSGVLYLKVPQVDEAQREKNYISGRRAGFITFLSGGKRSLDKSVISFEPVVGDLYLFPGWLLHGVEPFDGPGERRSVAFNADVHVPQ